MIPPCPADMPPLLGRFFITTPILVTPTQAVNLKRKKRGQVLHRSNPHLFFQPSAMAPARVTSLVEKHWQSKWVSVWVESMLSQY